LEGSLKITIIGTGYVGLVSGACLAELGNDVMCLDIDTEKIAILKRGKIPIYEPGLEPLVERNIAVGRLHFTTSVLESVAHGQVQFIAVGTPAEGDGSADLQYVLAAARGIGQHMEDYRLIVNKSTVPVGTAEKVRSAVAEELAERGKRLDFSVVSNPEFLKEGAAVEDFMRPDRIVIGASDEHAIQLMRAIYAPIQRNHERMIVMDIPSAELTKYAANAMLATRISFMNEIANLAEKLNADIEHVRQGIGSDARIGYHFLYAGCGYGGACFPKDVNALQQTARDNGMNLGILEAVDQVNQRQKFRLLEKIAQRFGDKLAGMRFAVWGLAFKPNTDDMRGAPSQIVVSGLIERGAVVSVYDPVAIDQARKMFSGLSGIEYASTPQAALDDANCLVIITEWKEFRSPDFDDIKRRLKTPIIIDGRNLYEPALVRGFGFEYSGIGRA
jgi:UDPglucose 6-dehydrogenase